MVIDFHGPLTALFRVDQKWGVFVVDAGHARLRRVTLGERNGTVAAVLDELTEGEQVIAHPSDRIADGVRIEIRT